jgi:hypothetical protein
MLSKINEKFNRNVFNTRIHMNVACREAQEIGVPVRMHKINAQVSKDYESLAREIMELYEFDAGVSSSQAKTGVTRNHLKDFVVSAPEAHSVHVVGDFNEWKLSQDSRLISLAKGIWQKRLALPKGRYRYKFVIDGEWIVDPENQCVETNLTGSMDSILEIA